MRHSSTHTPFEQKNFKLSAYRHRFTLCCHPVCACGQEQPARSGEINWDAVSTKDLARRACFDCHSNETVWPWYAYVAPVSWRVAEHVEHGREHLNFSEWDRGNEDFEEAKEEVKDGGMPLSDYLRLHPEAKLTEAETIALLEGLARTYEADTPIERLRGPPPSSTP